jgi:hypothetical protein
VCTADGVRITVFYTRSTTGLIGPRAAANQAPPELRTARAIITRHVDDYASRMRTSTMVAD